MTVDTLSSPTVLSDPLQDIPDQLDVSDSVLLISSPPPISPNYSSLAVVHSNPLLLPHSSSTPLSSPQSSFVMNPLVAAGLVNPDLADIPATPPNNAAVTKQRVKRIVGARDLTSNEYTEMLRADKIHAIASISFSLPFPSCYVPLFPSSSFFLLQSLLFS